MLVTTVGFGLIAYGRERGFKTMLYELVRAPQRVANTLTTRPAVTVGLFLWGMSISLLIGSVITQAMAGILSIGFLIAAPSLLANVLNNFVIRVWSAVLGNFTPEINDEVDHVAAPLTVMLGQAVGLIMAFLMGDSLFGGITWAVKIVMALACAAVSYAVVVFGNKITPGQAAVLVLIVGTALIAWHVGHAPRAFADDGGWQECKGSGKCKGFFAFFTYFQYSGSQAVVSRGFLGGFGAGIGAALGALLGGTVGSLSRDT